MHFPFSRDGVAVPQEYAATLGEPTITKVRLWNGDDVWFASRYDHVRAILGDARFCASARHEKYPALTEARGAVTDDDPEHMLRLNAPEHTHLRRMFSARFSHSEVTRIAADISQVVEQLLDAMIDHGQPADLVEHFALPLPSRMIAMMLGVPYEDHDFFQDCTRRKLDMTIDPAVAVQAGRDQRDYVRNLMHEKNKAPDTHDDMIGNLLVNHINTGELSFEDAVGNIELLVIAGHETTANMTALGALSLLQDKALFEAVRCDDGGRYTKQVIEEMLRFYAIVQMSSVRVAREDIEIGGVTIRKGEGVLAMITGANHDPEKFTCPERFDADRPRLPPNLAFGFGIHQCLGQSLARTELLIAFRTLTRRLPTLRLAVPASELVYKGHSFVHGVEAMPVIW
jgi:cytochrome P450